MTVYKPYEILDYSLGTLVETLANKSGASRAEVQAKSHIAYFDGYFSHLGAKTIVVENDYVDRDFLEDYAGYYARCFVDYPRRCTRLHFFDSRLTRSAFRKLLSGTEGSRMLARFKSSYLGFVVVKPLPQTIIGRTCLRTYGDDPLRSFPAVRNYEVSLFGIDLQVETLGFQEQDTAAAACATSALWSAFQRTGLLFQHPIPTPVSITEAATSGVHARERAFPNHGLNLEQMADAVRSVGLDPYVLDVSSEELLKTAVVGYLGMGIPSILVVRLLRPVTGGYHLIGDHAVTVGGFHTASSPPQGYRSLSGIPTTAARVDKIYANDDQVGPFARMQFDGLAVADISQAPPKDYTLSLSTGAGGPNSGVRAVPLALLVPLYNKIRIPFSAVHESVVRLHPLLAQLGSADLMPTNVEWDIKLTTVSQLKREIRSDATIGKDMRSRLLLRNWPRFLWRATLTGNGQRLLDFLFDATDLEQGDFVIEAIEYNPIVASTLRSVAGSLAQRQQLSQFGRTLSWFI